MTTTALSTYERRYLQELVSDLAKDATAVVLVGSRARGTSDQWSDVDILVVGSGETPKTRGRVQIIQASEAELSERLERGDDFAAWVLRFGKPISGRRRWEQLKARLSRQERWPDAGIKRRKAEVHLRAARALMGLGDEEAAQEEARIALSHLARGLLLEREVFPLSRPELPGQLEAVEASNLARGLASRDLPLAELIRVLESHLGRGGDGQPAG